MFASRAVAGKPEPAAGELPDSGDEVVAGSRRAARPRGRRRRRDAGRRAGHRRGMRRGGCHGRVHRPHHPERHAAVRLRPGRDDRGDGRARHRARAGPASRSPSTISTRRRCAASPSGSRGDHGHIDVLVNDIWGGEMLKGGPAQWNTPIWELDLDDGLRILRLADRHPPHHVAPPAAAARRPARRPGGRGDRRHHRLQRVAVPDLGVLRPGQGRGEPAGVLAGPRARAVRRDGGRRSRRDGCARR